MQLPKRFCLPIKRNRKKKHLPSKTQISHRANFISQSQKTIPYSLIFLALNLTIQYANYPFLALHQSTCLGLLLSSGLPRRAGPTLTAPASSRCFQLSGSHFYGSCSRRPASTQGLSAKSGKISPSQVGRPTASATVFHIAPFNRWLAWANQGKPSPFSPASQPA